MKDELSIVIWKKSVGLPTKVISKIESFLFNL